MAFIAERLTAGLNPQNSALSRKRRTLRDWISPPYRLHTSFAYRCGTLCLSHASRSSCFQLFRSCDRLTRPLCSSPITGPSSLLRVGPPQCSASVLSPRGFGRLGFSLPIGATGSCSSVQPPASASRLLYAGRHPLSHQAPSRFIPGEILAPGFDDT
jgi:hypothetical protein